MTLIKYLTFAICTLLTIAPPLAAQSGNPYRTRIIVNERVVTEYEITQRTALLQVLGTPGEPRELAIKQLIDERLYLQAGDEIGIRPTEGEIDQSMASFVARGNLGINDFLTLIDQNGVTEQSFRDFIRARLTWRTVIQARFASRVEITPEEINSALDAISGGAGREFRFSEIYLPYAEYGEENANSLALRLSNSLNARAAFGDAARKYSKTSSAEFGGIVEWTNALNLPPSMVGQFLLLGAGRPTGPVVLDDGVGVFMLLDQRRADTQTEVEPLITSYATLTLPASAGDANRRAALARVIRTEIDTCFDLREQAAPYGDNFYQDATLGGSTPSDIRRAVALLDDGESKTISRSNGSTVIVMACSRERDLPEEGLANLQNRLVNQRFTALGSGYLQELRAEAFIERK